MRKLSESGSAGSPMAAGFESLWSEPRPLCALKIGTHLSQVLFIAFAVSFKYSNSLSHLLACLLSL